MVKKRYTDNDILTTSEVGQLLGCSESCVRKWEKRGVLIPFRLPSGRHRRYYYSQIKPFLTQRETFRRDVANGE